MRKRVDVHLFKVLYDPCIYILHILSTKLQQVLNNLLLNSFYTGFILRRRRQDRGPHQEIPDNICAG